MKLCNVSISKQQNDLSLFLKQTIQYSVIQKSEAPTINMKRLK